jgi:predicted DNA-binding protein YlxM (UPF0122 family)
MAKNGDRIKRIKEILNKFYKKLAQIEAEEKKLEDEIQSGQDTQNIEEIQKKIQDL